MAKYSVTHTTPREHPSNGEALSREKIGEHPTLSMAQKAAHTHFKENYPESEAKRLKFEQDKRSKSVQVAKAQPSRHEHYSDPVKYSIREHELPYWDKKK